MSDKLAPATDLAALTSCPDPYPRYAEARGRGAVLRAGAGQWVVPGYHQVAALLRDPRLSHQFPEEYHQLVLGDGPAVGFARRIVLNRDPPDHARLRAALGLSLGPVGVRRLAPAVRRFAGEAIATAAARGHLEAVSELAHPLPVMAACELVGVPTADRPLIRGWATDLSLAFSSLTLTAAERERADDAVTAARAYVTRLAGDRAHPLTAAWLANHSDRDPAADREELVDNIVFLFFAGFETTVNVIGTACAALLEHPSELARLRADRSLVPAAVEEVLRWDAPIQVTSRLVAEPLEAGGRRLRPGRVVHLLLGSANRDPERFPSADRFDAARRPNPHVTFGGGPHACLGAALARLEVTAVLDALLEHRVRLEPAGPVVRRADPRFRGFTRIPARLTAA